MVQLVAVSQARHAARKWQHHADYRFAATEALAPIVGAELAKAALSMPLAFSEQAGRYTLVAVLSLVPGRNMFVGPDGRWYGNYIPACLRSYPFSLLAQQAPISFRCAWTRAVGLSSRNTLLGKSSSTLRATFRQR